VGVPPACIRESRADAVAVLTTTLERHGLTAAEAGAAAGESLLVGTDADIVEALDAWGAAGAVQAIVDWPPPFDRTTLDRLAALAA
jgi:alkanesulfonate monooxygenase SsuD/methylene tetrahydromethanopterin reductase-like flavin-dependent oxidoreductase (luciferase family)